MFAEHVRFEQPAVGGEEGLQLGTLGAAQRLPAPQEQPPFAAAVLAHRRPGPKELLTPHLIERGEACCRTWNLSNTASARGKTSVTTLRYGRCMSMHTASTAARCRASRSVGEQRPQTVFAAIPLQADHLAAHHVGEHRPELLPFSALNFIDAQMSRPVFRPRPIPRVEKRAFCSARRPPTHGVAHGRVTRRHRLTIEPDPLAEPARHPRVGIGEPDALGADPAVPTPDAGAAR